MKFFLQGGDGEELFVDAPTVGRNPITSTYLPLVSGMYVATAAFPAAATSDQTIEALKCEVRFI